MNVLKELCSSRPKSAPQMVVGVNLTIEFSRLCLALSAFGLALFSGLLPLLIQERSARFFSFLTCLCGTFCLVLSFPSNISQLAQQTIFIPIGISLMAVCQVLLKNIPRIRSRTNDYVTLSTTVDPVGDEDCEEGEIELMIPRSSSEPSSSSLPFERFPKNRVTITDTEVSFLCISNLLALFILSFNYGLNYTTKEHVGYGKLIATLGFVCLMAMTQGVLVLRTQLLSEKYMLFISTLSCGYPLGIIFGLTPSLTLLFTNSLFSNTIHSLVSLSHGVLLYIALMALAGSEVRARGKSQAKIGGILCGTILAVTLLYINVFL